MPAWKMDTGGQLASLCLGGGWRGLGRGGVEQKALCAKAGSPHSSAGV